MIIPTFNSGETLEKCLASIVSQSYVDIEVLVVDGSSNDKTLEIVRDFKEKYPFIGYVSEKDQGIYDAMNKGIARAKGKWLFFMGSDDEFYDNKVLEKVYSANLSLSRNVGVIYGSVEIIGNSPWANNGTIYDGPFDTKKLLTKNICHQAIFYNTHFIRSGIGYYNIAYRLCADWDFNLRCWSKNDFYYLDLIIARFTAGGESTRTQTDENFTNEFLRNVLTYFNISPFHKLVNNPSFVDFYKVCLLQKKENYLKYIIQKVKRKLAIH